MNEAQKAALNRAMTIITGLWRLLSFGVRRAARVAVRPGGLGRKTALGLLLLFAWLGIAAIPSGPQTVTLAWDYPAAELGPDLVFIIRHNKDVTTPLDQWAVLTNVAGTNLSVSIQLEPGLRYFTATASNFWGESDFSNVARVPAPPRSGALSVRRGL